MPDTLLFVSNSAHAATLQEQLAPYFSILQAPDIQSAERLLSQTPEITAIVAEDVFTAPLCALTAIDYPGLPVVVLANQPDTETQLLALGAAEILRQRGRSCGRIRWGG